MNSINSIHLHNLHSYLNLILSNGLRTSTKQSQVFHVLKDVSISRNNQLFTLLCLASSVTDLSCSVEYAFQARPEQHRRVAPLRSLETQNI